MVSFKYYICSGCNQRRTDSDYYDYLGKRQKRCVHCVYERYIRVRAIRALKKIGFSDFQIETNPELLNAQKLILKIKSYGKHSGIEKFFGR